MSTSRPPSPMPYTIPPLIMSCIIDRVSFRLSALGFEPRHDPLHDFDLGLLATNDSLTKRLDLAVLNGCFLAHENRAPMVRDHGPQELLIPNGGLLPDGKPECREHYEAD